MSGASCRIRAMSGVFVPPTRGRSMPSGKIQKSVMPTTASPAPRAKRVSVSEGTSETTRISLRREKVAFFPCRPLRSVGDRAQQPQIRLGVARSGREIERLIHVVRGRVIDAAEPVARHGRAIDLRIGALVAGLEMDRRNPGF